MRASVIGNREAVWIDPVINEAYINPETCANYKDVNMDGVNGLVVYITTAGTRYIMQAGGYTYDRGLFCDLYNPVIEKEA